MDMFARIRNASQLSAPRDQRWSFSLFRTRRRFARARQRRRDAWQSMWMQQAEANTKQLYYKRLFNNNKAKCTHTERGVRLTARAGSGKTASNGNVIGGNDITYLYVELLMFADDIKRPTN